LSLLLFGLAYYFVTPHFQLHGLWFSLLVFLGARGIIQWGVFWCRGVEME